MLFDLLTCIMQCCYIQYMIIQCLIFQFDFITFLFFFLQSCFRAFDICISSMQDFHCAMRYAILRSTIIHTPSCHYSYFVSLVQTNLVVTKSGSSSPSRRNAELRILIARHFFICAWIFAKLGGFYSGTSRSLPQTLNFTKLPRYRLNLRKPCPNFIKSGSWKSRVESRVGISIASHFVNSF